MMEWLRFWITAALLLASAAGLSLAEGAFDVTVFEASPYYHFDRFDNAWSVEATYTAADAASNSRLTFSFGTNSTMVAWKQPFMFRIAFQSSGIAQTATSLSVYLDDVRTEPVLIGEKGVLGVKIPAGEHTVSFRYRQRILLPSILLSILGLGLAMVYLRRGQGNGK